MCVWTCIWLSHLYSGTMIQVAMLSDHTSALHSIGHDFHDRGTLPYLPLEKHNGVGLGLQVCMTVLYSM